ncbi:helix-turn-helix domain-containing protein [Alkalihalobacillus sp. 1P02AB]|uniref:helix-turn-helix domain-containing protein n=1 Tax=Alkalihalobacillus sp. 1P02AB TaxID=3132260 RepID=UPI0039A5EBA3
MKNYETPEEEDAKKMKLLKEQLNKEVGNIIRALRKVDDISQDELAYQLKISERYLVKIENGDATMNFQTYLLIRNYFGKESFEKEMSHIDQELVKLIKQQNEDL